MPPPGGGSLVPRSLTGETAGLRPVFSPTEEVIACGSDKDVLLLSSRTGEVMGRLCGHTARVTCLAFNRGKYLFSGSIDGTVRAWDFTSGNRRSLHVHPLGGGSEVVGMSLHPTDATTLYLLVAKRPQGPSSAAASSTTTTSSSKDKKKDKKKKQKQGEDGTSGEKGKEETTGRRGRSSSKGKKASKEEKDEDASAAEAEPQGGGGAIAVAAAPSAAITTLTHDGGGRPVKKWVLAEYNVTTKCRVNLATFKDAPFFVQAQEVDARMGGDSSSTGGVMVVAASPKTLVVWNVKDKALQSKVRFDDANPRAGSYLRSAAVSPTKAEIATGDVNGRVYVWQNLFEKMNEEEITKDCKSFKSAKKSKARHLLRAEVKRWHSHGVWCLSFSPDGIYLYSGGEEGVFVICQLPTGHLDFLPRLGSPLVSITPSGDGLSCVLVTKANRLRLMSPSDLRTRWEMRGLAYTPPEGPHGSSRLRLWSATHARQGVLITNALPGKLQFYDLAKESVMHELEVVPFNQVSRTEHEKVVPPRVSHVALSQDGSRLATVEVRVGEEDIRRVYLKFWDWHEPTRQWHLTAVVAQPHQGGGGGSADLCALAYHPRMDLVVTSDKAGTFKIWALTDEDRLDEDGDDDGALVEAGRRRKGNSSRSKRSWSCQATVSFRPEAARCVAFSEDGTVLAVSYAARVALWDPLEVRLLTCVESGLGGSGREEVRYLAFPSTTTAGAYLLVAGSTTIAVIDLLTMAVTHRYESESVRAICVAGRDETSLVPTPSTTTTTSRGGKAVHFAAVLRGAGDRAGVDPDTLCLFNINESSPVTTQVLEHQSPILTMVALDGPPSARGLVCLTRDGVTCLAPPFKRPKAPKPPTTVASLLRATTTKRALTTAAQEEASSSSSKRPRAIDPSGVVMPAATGSGSVKEILGGASTSHLPSPSAVFDSVLAGLLPPPATAAAASGASTQGVAGDGSSRRRSRRHEGAAAMDVDDEEGGSDNAVVVAASSSSASGGGAGQFSSATSLPPCGIRDDLLGMLVEALRGRGGANGAGGAEGVVANTPTPPPVQPTAATSHGSRTNNNHHHRRRS